MICLPPEPGSSQAPMRWPCSQREYTGRRWDFQERGEGRGEAMLYAPSLPELLQGTGPLGLQRFYCKGLSGLCASPLVSLQDEWQSLH